MDDPFSLANILLVEDCPADAELVRFVFEEAKLSNELQVISDGKEALDRLLQRGAYEGAPFPDLVFLDLNLPGLPGKEIIERLIEERKHNMPIVVLTGCEAEQVLAADSGIRADYFLVKPLDLPKLIETVKNLRALYLGIMVAQKNERQKTA